MTSSHDQQPYVLSYRRDNVEEDRRLNSQHEVIMHGILDGILIHPSIHSLGSKSVMADLGCGTGVWLEDVANMLFTGGQATREDPAKLIGFDTNPHAFNPNPAPGIQLVEHDCTQPFDAKYIGVFDLVNIRGLAYALPRESFSRFIENAVQLLRPGGYLQWLETDAWLFRAYPDTAEISEALTIVNAERQERDLVPYLPHFMLQKLLSLDPRAGNLSEDTMTILNFNLLPGGITRESWPQDVSTNERFSDIVLESVKLLLEASLIRKKSRAPEESPVGEGGTGQSGLPEIQKLMDFIDEARKSDRIKMGGVFPQLIAQKTTRL